MVTERGGVGRNSANVSHVTAAVSTTSATASRNSCRRIALLWVGIAIVIIWGYSAALVRNCLGLKRGRRRHPAPTPPRGQLPARSEMGESQFSCVFWCHTCRFCMWALGFSSCLSCSVGFHAGACRPTAPPWHRLSACGKRCSLGGGGFQPPRKSFSMSRASAPEDSPSGFFHKLFGLCLFRMSDRVCASHCCFLS